MRFFYTRFNKMIMKYCLKSELPMRIFLIQLDFKMKINKMYFDRVLFCFVFCKNNTRKQQKNTFFYFANKIT